MKLKIFLLLFSATLVGTGIWLKLEERREILETVEQLKRRWCPDFELQAVAEVFIRTNTDSLLIGKQGDHWLIDAPQNQVADLAVVGQLVQSLKNLKPTEKIPASPSQFASFDLLAPDGHSQGAGTFVELRDGDSKRLAAFIIGKKSFAPPDPKSPFPSLPNGRFIISADSDGPVGVVPESFDNVTPKPENWISPWPAH
ncbi:MAG: DUF4340 domain-containing protein [bacterium]